MRAWDDDDGLEGSDMAEPLRRRRSRGLRDRGRLLGEVLLPIQLRAQVEHWARPDAGAHGRMTGDKPCQHAPTRHASSVV